MERAGAAAGDPGPSPAGGAGLPAAATRELLTDRLWLRPVGGPDLDQLHRMFAEAGFRRYLLDGEEMPRDWVAGEIADSRRGFRRHGWGTWAVRRRARRGIVGCCGLREFHRPPVLELYYGIACRHWGRGYATEAAGAVIDDAFERLGFERLRASVDRPNRRSVAVLQRLGFTPEPAGGETRAVDRYRLERDRWRARRPG